MASDAFRKDVLAHSSWFALNCEGYYDPKEWVYSLWNEPVIDKKTGQPQKDEGGGMLMMVVVRVRRAFVAGTPVVV